MNLDDINIKVKGNYSQLDWEDNSGAKRTRFVNTHDLGAALSDVAGGEGAFIPPNCRYLKDGIRTIIAYEVPPVICDLKYDHGGNHNLEMETIQQVPYPRGLTVLTLSRNSAGYHFSHMHQFALKGPLRSMDDDLYYWPYPNMFEDCKMCIGSKIIKDYPTLAATSGFPQYVYEGINNNDLSHWKHAFIQLPTDNFFNDVDGVDWFKTLAKEGRFNPARLRKYASFHSFIKSCI